MLQITLENRALSSYLHLRCLELTQECSNVDIIVRQEIFSFSN